METNQRARKGRRHPIRIKVRVYKGALCAHFFTHSMEIVIAESGVGVRSNDFTDSDGNDDDLKVFLAANEAGLLVGWEPMEEGLKCPKKSSPLASAYDVFVPCDITIEPSETHVVPLKQKLAVPPTLHAVMHTRTSYARAGVFVMGGIIDCDFNGEIGCILNNTSSSVFRIKKGSACCQIQFASSVRNTQFFPGVFDVKEKRVRDQRGQLERAKVNPSFKLERYIDTCFR